MSAILEFRQATKAFRGIPAIKNIDFTLQRRRDPRDRRRERRRQIHADEGAGRRL